LPWRCSSRRRSHRRITTPLRRLTEASRDLAEGDFARRVPADAIEDGPVELSDLGLQFNAMAERLQESVEIIRRDRDRSRSSSPMSRTSCGPRSPPCGRSTSS
jgi:methyl-accepting chemotaxis protein